MNDGPIIAHLNGGPWDDDSAVLPPGRMIYAPWRLPYAGRYEARIDGNGDLVPYNLDGEAEYDWVPPAVI